MQTDSRRETGRQAGRTHTADWMLYVADDGGGEMGRTVLG